MSTWVLFISPACLFYLRILVFRSRPSCFLGQQVPGITCSLLREKIKLLDASAMLLVIDHPLPTLAALPTLKGQRYSSRIVPRIEFECAHIRYIFDSVIAVSEQIQTLCLV